MAIRVAVLGGGVIGLASARALAGRGASVDLFEANTRSKESSWAAAGILGPGSEFAEDSPHFRVALEALRRWPGLAAELGAETGIDLAFSDEGTILVAATEEEMGALRARARFLSGAGLPAEVLTTEAARGIEPALGPGIVGGIHVREGRLDNRALWAALLASCKKRGVGMRLGEPVLALARDGNRVRGVRLKDGEPPFDAVVVAAGAWSRQLGATVGLPLPTVPVKGQMVRLAAPDGALRHVVKRGLAYAVPHRGRGVVVGTTAEEVGFDRTTHEEALAGLVGACARLIPAAANWARVEEWMGFRPRLPDMLPAIGAVPSRPGLFVATGHYRNGILLCAATGDLIAGAVLGQPDPRLASFSPGRPALLAIGV